jgi:hypothetical protein
MNVARIERRNTPVDPADTIDAHSRMPQKVADIFQRACADCHTEQTHWPWYSKVAPFQWLITADVYGGRAHLNLSTWGRYKEDQRAERLAGICEMVSGDRMPLLHYRLAHYPAAWLSENDKKAVCDWVKAEVGLNAAGAAEPRRSGPELDTPSAKMVARRPDDISE